MRPTPRSALLFSLSVFVTGISCATALAAAPAVSIPKAPKLKEVRVELDVAGYVETRQLKDTTSKCFPGETYVQTNRFEFETGRYVRTKITNISLPGTDGVITSSFSKAVGSATVEGLLSNYRTTNYCPPSPPEAEPKAPTCTKTRGKIAVALTPGGTDADGDLAGLGGKRLMLSIARRGGGRQDPSCSDGGVPDLVSGVDGDRTVVTTSRVPAVSEVLPSGLTAIKVFNLRRGKRLRRVIVVDGPCRSLSARALTPPGRSPAAGALNADGDCRLTAKVVLTIRAAG